MSATSHHLLLFVLLFLASSLHLAAPMIPAPPPAAEANTTAHHLLTLFGLPEGILPGNVANCTTESDEGDFTVELSEPCYVRFTDLVYYDRTITGRLTHGLISRLHGVQVRKFFIWLGITRVAARKGDGGSVVITAGFVSEKHPVSEFLDVRPCEKRGAGESSSSSLLQSGSPGGVAAA